MIAVGCALLLSGCASTTLTVFDAQKKLEGVEGVGCDTAETASFTEPFAYEALICNSESGRYYLVISDAIASETFDVMACGMLSEVISNLAFSVTLRGENWFVGFDAETYQFAEPVKHQLGGELGNELANCAS